jgi:exocyst complex component 1
LEVPALSSSSLSPSLVAPSPMSAYAMTALPSPETARPHLSASPVHSASRSQKNSAVPGEAVTPSQARREPNARVSFFDPANQAALDRLLSGDVLPGDDFDEDDGEVEVAAETAQAMLDSVEEMLEGYEWASGELFAPGRATTDQIEARLLGELMALEKVRE